MKIMLKELRCPLKKLQSYSGRKDPRIITKKR
jgi:hypothetical protein